MVSVAVARSDLTKETNTVAVVGLVGVAVNDPEDITLAVGTDADGTENPAFCKWCYDGGEFADATMDEVIEKSAPYLVQATGVSLDEAVSFMGALLPTLDRWKQ